MKKICIILFLLSGRSYGEDCQAHKPDHTYFPQKSKLFFIDYYKDYKILHRGYDQVLLQNKNSTLPCQTKLFKIQIPVSRVILTSTTQLAALEILSLESALIGFQGKKYIYSNHFPLSKITNISLPLISEELIKSQADLVVAYDLNIYSDKQIKQMRKLQIPIVLNSDYLEQDPLARAEWLVYMSVFFNKENEAQIFFANIVNKYEEIKNKLLKIREKKKILVGEIQNGKWVTCGGKSDLAKMITDAGGELLLASKKPLTERKSLEELYLLNTNVDVWLTQNLWINKNEIEKDSRYKKIKTKTIFNNNRKLNLLGANDYWEMGMARPDIILADLATVFYPKFFTDHELVWYKKI